MKKILILLSLFYIASSAASAQTRFHSLNPIHFLRSSSLQILIENIYEGKMAGKPGFLDEHDSKGFYIDGKAKLIVSTSIIWGYKDDGTSYIKNKERHSIAIDDCEMMFLSELINVAIATSTPQNDYDIMDAPMYYLISDIGICDGHEYTGGTYQRDLIDLCGTICEACSREDHSMIESLMPLVENLIQKYRTQLVFDFWIDDNTWHTEMGIGLVNSYLYILVSIRSGGYRPEYESTMTELAEYLLSINEIGKIQCCITIGDEEGVEEMPHGYYSLSVSPENFTIQKLKKLIH